MNLENCSMLVLKYIEHKRKCCILKSRFPIIYDKDKMRENIIKTIKYSGNEIYSLSNEFLNHLIELLDQDEDLGIIFPPKKEGKKENLKWVENWLLNNECKENIIKISSCDYSLHHDSDQSFESRNKRLDEAYKSWKLISEKSPSEYKNVVIIDDLFTAGSTTSKLIQFAVDNGFIIKKEEVSNCIYLDNIFGIYLAKTFNNDHNEKNLDYWNYNEDLSNRINNSNFNIKEENKINCNPPDSIKFKKEKNTN